METMFELDDFKVRLNERQEMFIVRTLQDGENLILLKGDTRTFVQSLIYAFNNKKGDK